MGIVFGRITEETPKFDIVSKSKEFEIRQYTPSLVAEVTYEGDTVKEGVGKAFTSLAGYIGVLSKPKNIKPGSEESGEKVAMTAPVITQVKASGEKIAMTAPVLTAEAKGGDSKKTMQFVLPSKYTMETVPKPTDPHVEVKELASRKVGVMTFSGNLTQSFVDSQVAKLRAALEAAGHKVTGDYQVAQYNPPFTLWFLRTNEIMFPVE